MITNTRLHARPLSANNLIFGFDAVLVLSVFGLLLMGLLMVFSSTIGMQGKSVVTNFAHFKKQIMFTLMGAFLAAIVVYIPVNFWSKYSFSILCVCAFMMLILLFVGKEINGSTRWVRVGPINIQPSEIVKLMSIAYIASYLARKREVLEEFTRGIVIIGVVVAVIGGLLLMQPDFGSLVVILAAAAAMMFLGGVKIRHMFVCVTGLAVLIPVLIMTQPYRMKRVLSFGDPFANYEGSGYQLAQSLIAIGRGELFGVGIGGSIQKLSYLPHPHNDFILAVIGEELGLAGIVLVVSLFAVFLWRAFMIARKSEEAGMYYGARLAQGIGLLVVIQALINIGVNLGALPTKGLNLPFISYGGSSILMNFVGLGILFAIDRQSRERSVKAPFVESTTEMNIDPLLKASIGVTRSRHG